MLQPDGTLIDANKAPLEAAGISLDDVLGKKFWDCFWWNYDPAVQRQLKVAVERAAAGEISRYDAPVQMEGGNIMTIGFMIAPLLDEQGHITHLIPSANDINELRSCCVPLKTAFAPFLVIPPMACYAR